MSGDAVSLGPERVELAIRSLPVIQNVHVLFVSDFSSDVGFRHALALQNDLVPSGVSNEYILLRRPTNSRGSALPVSDLLAQFVLVFR